MTISRRKIPRFRIRIKVHCLISQPDLKEPLLAHTENLSLKGMRIRFIPSADSMNCSAIQIDTPYDFKVYIDEGEAPIILTGKVVYSDPNGSCFGVKFSNTPKDSEILLSKFVTNMATNNPELILSDP